MLSVNMLVKLSPEVDLIESSSYELDFLKMIDDNRNLYYDEDFIARYISDTNYEWNPSTIVS